MAITVGVLALQGGFVEHVSMLEKTAAQLVETGVTTTVVSIMAIRTPKELARCNALVIPGGESTTMALIASRSGLLEPLRNFVRVQKKPTWGTCAGLVLLSQETTGTKIGGQELIGGLDILVHRNHFGRQKQSFVADVDIPLLQTETATKTDMEVRPFPAVFIRAPVVKALLSSSGPEVQVLAVLPETAPGMGDIVAVRQGNVLGTSFHPELTNDIRLHAYWLRLVIGAVVH